MLVQTSLANRTSPVLRGKWVMEVLLGTPPPPPPPDVPDLEKTGEAQGRPPADDARAHGDASREPDVQLVPPVHGSDRPRARQLRRDRAVAHARERHRRSTRTATSTTARRSRRRRSCSRRCSSGPTPLVRTFTENLMAYALGRRVEYYDQPTDPRIAHDAEQNGYKMRRFILGVVKSDAFRMKRDRHVQAVAGRPPKRRTEAATPDNAATQRPHGEQRSCISSRESRCPVGRSSRRLGATVALPFLDAMVPTGRWRMARGRRRDAPRRHRNGARRRRLQQAGRDDESVGAGGGRTQLRSRADSAAVARAVSRLPDDRQQHRRAHGRADDAGKSAATTSARARCS